MTIRELIILRIEKTKKRITALKQRIKSLEEKHKGNELKDFITLSFDNEDYTDGGVNVWNE
ncbi:hypothetical protein PG593_05195 [Riemerella anatipestifer]|nr:hypothetical protein [Riemerella anatipestifer]